MWGDTQSLKLKRSRLVVGRQTVSETQDEQISCVETQSLKLKRSRLVVWRLKVKEQNKASSCGVTGLQGNEWDPPTSQWQESHQAVLLENNRLRGTKAVPFTLVPAVHTVQTE